MFKMLVHVQKIRMIKNTTTGNALGAIMFDTEEKPFGETWKVWTTRWWLWFLSMPIQDNPAFDKTGERCHIGQTDPNVWFLATTTGGKAERTIIIPSKKALLFPVINITTSFSENPNLKNEEEMICFTDKHMDNIAKKEVNIDGVDLTITEGHRVRSLPFDFFYPADNIYGAPSGLTRGVGDGYWIFLRPLTHGKHNIRTFGSCMSGRVQIGVSLHLIVND
jgi:hypothetical protein